MFRRELPPQDLELSGGGALIRVVPRMNSQGVQALVKKGEPFGPTGSGSQAKRVDPSPMPGSPRGKIGRYPKARSPLCSRVHPLRTGQPFEDDIGI